MKKLSLVLMMVLFAVGTILAQRSVSGTVIDDAGEPLIGANVLVKGTSVGVATDLDGKYSVDVPAGSNALVFSYTGFETKEVELGASNVVDVTLSEGVVITEVVVTAIGLEANRAQLGYSVQNVNVDEIVGSQETNLVNALSSKVAGVTVVSSSGSPGSSANIRVRGSTSINGSNSPLFVIDGVPIDNNENRRGGDGQLNGTAGVDQSNRAIDINPNDIESLTVLKGPSATALYGVRAANGAVIITTKKGKAGKPQVDISASFTLSQYNKMPDRQSTYAQGRPADTDGDGVPDARTWRGPETAEGFSWGPAISELEYDGDNTYPYDLNGALVPRGTGNGQAANAYDPYDFFVNGEAFDLNASVRGGTDRFNYYLSGGRLTSTGIVPNSTFDRTSFRITTEAKITDKLTAALSANFVNSGGNRIQRGSNLNGVMLGLMRTTPTFDNGNGKTGQAAADDVNSYVVPGDGSQRSYRAGVYDNPNWTVNKNPFNDDVNRIIGFGSLRYEVNDWLSFMYKLGIDTYSDRRKGAFDINPSPFGFNWNDGSIYQSTEVSRDLNSDFLVMLNRQLTDDIGLTATFGHNYFTTRVVNQFSQGTTLATSDFYHISNATNIISGEIFQEKKIWGLLGTIDLNYKDYLYLNLTGRNDWSSTLPEDNNSFSSYSASLGFAFTELMEKNNILSYGKLRLSYGKVGNDAPIYSTTNYFGQAISGGDGFITGLNYPAFGTNAFEKSTILANPELRPESTTTFEVGGEFKFLKGRLGVDITYYDSESVDQVISVQVSGATGFTNLNTNAGKITNTGIELVLEGTPVKMPNFTWDIGVNFTKLENDVEELADGIEQIGLSGFTSTSSRVVVGQPYGAIFGSGFQRTDDGQMIIGDNGWPLQDPQTQVYGDPNPDWIAGVRNTFTIFKNFSVSALIDIRQGGDMWCGTCGIIDYFGTSQTSADLREQTVVWDGVVNIGTADEPNYVANTKEVAYADPAAGVGGSYWARYGFGGITEMSIYETSWVRLRDLSLTYRIPNSALEKLSIADASVSVSGRNLWLSTDYPGIDPETNLTGATNGFGLDYFNMPNTKSYAFTLRLSF